MPFFFQRFLRNRDNAGLHLKSQLWLFLYFISVAPISVSLINHVYISLHLKFHFQGTWSKPKANYNHPLHLMSCPLLRSTGINQFPIMLTSLTFPFLWTFSLIHTTSFPNYYLTFFVPTYLSLKRIACAHFSSLPPLIAFNALQLTLCLLYLLKLFY